MAPGTPQILMTLVVTTLSIGLTWGLPYTRQYCPIQQNLNEFNATKTGSSESSSGRFIDLSKTDGRKIRIHFYTPNPARAIEKQLEDTTLAFPYFVDDTTGAIVPLIPIRVPDLSSSTESGAETTDVDTERTTTLTSPVKDRMDGMDIFCQWEFQAANESEYLLLTFQNLSAPFSTDCAESYVSMQKDNGYESRWCGNRRQANARPMSLFSKNTAKITVFKKATAPVYPPTGFTVTVESLDIFAISGVENSLRVLLG